MFTNSHQVYNLWITKKIRSIKCPLIAVLFPLCSWFTSIELTEFKAWKGQVFHVKFLLSTLINSDPRLIKFTLLIENKKDSAMAENWTHSTFNISQALFDNWLSQREVGWICFENGQWTARSNWELVRWKNCFGQPFFDRDSNRVAKLRYHNRHAIFDTTKIINFWDSKTFYR